MRAGLSRQERGRVKLISKWHAELAIGRDGEITRTWLRTEGAVQRLRWLAWRRALGVEYADDEQYRLSRRGAPTWVLDDGQPPQELDPVIHGVGLVYDLHCGHP